MVCTLNNRFENPLCFSQCYSSRFSCMVFSSHNTHCMCFTDLIYYNQISSFSAHSCQPPLLFVCLLLLLCFSNFPCSAGSYRQTVCVRSAWPMKLVCCLNQFGCSAESTHKPPYIANLKNPTGSRCKRLFDCCRQCQAPSFSAENSPVLLCLRQSRAPTTFFTYC